MTDDEESSTGEKTPKQTPSDLERTLASLPAVFNGSYGTSSLPSTVGRWTGPWMVGQLGQF